MTVVMFRGSRILSSCLRCVCTYEFNSVHAGIRGRRGPHVVLFLFIYFATTDGERESVIAGEQRVVLRPPPT